MSLLDQRMRIDLAKRLDGEDISAAKGISVAIKDDISSKGLPSYFFGDRNSRTVVVNLNPGENADKCDNAWDERTSGFGTSLDILIENSNPEIRIVTGLKGVDYNHLNKYINTVYDSNITEGFKIVYRGRVYDYSI